MAVQGKQCHFLENKIHHSKTLDVIRTRLNQRNEKKTRSYINLLCRVVVRSSRIGSSGNAVDMEYFKMHGQLIMTSNSDCYFDYESQAFVSYMGRLY